MKKIEIYNIGGYIMSAGIDGVIENMLAGRKLVLEESGLDVDKIDSFTSKEELFSYITQKSNGVEKNLKYLLSVAQKRFIPDTSNNGMAFSAFYDTAPQTTGDAAEVGLMLMERGRGHKVQREVKTVIEGEPEYDIFGEREKLHLKHRDSDLVIDHGNGKTVHVESKVGLTRGSQKKFDLRQELYGDVYRLDRDPNTMQQYVIFRNANNNLSQLDDRDYVKNLYIMKKTYGERVLVNFEGKYLSERDLYLLSQRPVNISIQTCLGKKDLIIEGKSCEVGVQAISESIDKTIRSVNGCDSIGENNSKILSIANEHDKISNFSSVYGLEPSPTNKFLSGFSSGARQNVKANAFTNGINALYEAMYTEKPKEKIIVDAIKNTALSAIRSGVIVGASNLAETVTRKQLAGVCGGALFDSARSFIDFCSGKIGAGELLNTTLKKAIPIGVAYVKAKAMEKTISGVASLGVKSAGASVFGTAKTGSALCGVLKGVGGAFLACAILSLLFESGDDKAKIVLPNDPRVTTFVEINEKGYCTITNSMNDNLIDKLINYNEKLALIDHKTSELNQKRHILSREATQKYKKIIDDLSNEVSIIERQILCQAERKALCGSENYHYDLRRSVEMYVERGMTAIKNQNIRLGELKELQLQLQDEKRCCDYISECCKNIIHMAENGNVRHEKIKKLISYIADDVSSNQILYRSNNFTTGQDILVGCLIEN